MYTKQLFSLVVTTLLSSTFLFDIAMASLTPDILEECIDKCMTVNHCCGNRLNGEAPDSSAQRLSCANGCEIAYYRTSVSQCKSDCREGNKGGCTYNHPLIPEKFSKCGDCQQSCNKWPDEGACEDGCEFATEFSEFYKGEEGGGDDDDDLDVINYCGMQETPDEVKNRIDELKEKFGNVINTLKGGEFGTGSGRRRLDAGDAVEEVSKFAQFFKDAAPYMGFVSGLLAYGKFIAELITADNVPSWAQDILDGVAEVSEKVDEIKGILNNGIAALRMENIKYDLQQQQDKINYLWNDYESYTEYPNDSSRTVEFRSQCNDNGNSPNDIFRTLYSRSCKDCSIYGGQIGINHMKDAGTILDVNSYDVKDTETFVKQIGVPILAAMADAFFFKAVCLPRSSDDECFFNDGGWKDDIEKMASALVEVAEHVDNQASKLEKCSKKKVRLYRVSKLDEGSFGRGDGKKFDFLFQLNGENYMPRDQSDCDNGLCRECNNYPSCPGWRVCRYSSTGWRRNTCQVPKIYYNDRFYPQSPEVDVDLRYTSSGLPRSNAEKFFFQGIEKDRGQNSKWRKFNIATFDLDDEIENGQNSCEEYKLTQTKTINGVNGCEVQLLVMPKLRKGM